MGDALDDATYAAISEFSETIFSALLVVVIVAIVITIPHLFISTRKSMRTSSTNSLIIGIALCDLIVQSGTIFDKVYQRYREDPCFNDNSYFFEFSYYASLFVYETFTRSSYYIGLSLALIRLLVISFPMNPTIGTLAKQSIGYYLMLLMFLLNILPSTTFYFQININSYGNWKPPKKCTQYPLKYKETTYVSEPPSEEYINVYLMMCGVLQITASVAHPVLAILLFLQIRKVEKRTANISRQGSSEKGRTSKMILLMTACYVVSGTPIGINLLIRQFAPPDSYFSLFTAISTLLEAMLFIINGSIHCIICFIMSTEYRKTVKSLLRIKEKENIVIVHSASIHG